MQDDSDTPPLWLRSTQKVEDRELRTQLASAAGKTWRRWMEFSEGQGGEAIDAIAALEYAVGAAVEAEATSGVRNADGYVFKAFLRKVGKLLRREERIDYRDPTALAELKVPDDADVVRHLEEGIQVKELMTLMDERTRTIFVMDCQGFSRRETARVLGISEDAVRKAYARGIERLQRLLSSRTTS